MSPVIDKPDLDLDPDSKRKKRRPNFSNNEMKILLNEVMKYHHIIESNKTDRNYNTLQAKSDVWNCILSEFNTKVYTQRTAQELRAKWENLKRAGKVEEEALREGPYKQILRRVKDILSEVKVKLEPFEVEVRSGLTF